MAALPSLGICHYTDMYLLIIYYFHFKIKVTKSCQYYDHKTSEDWEGVEQSLEKSCIWNIFQKMDNNQQNTDTSVEAMYAIFSVYS